MGKKGFTLIELLIVVAIIAILAAIAVPNFLEAQTRSKVARVKADQRSLTTGMEAYAVDYNHYPPNDGGGPPGVSQFRLDRFGFLTTPVAYMTSYPRDPFLPGATASPGQAVRTYQYFNYDRRWNPGAMPGLSTDFVSWGFLVQANPKTMDLRGACVKSYGPNAGRSGLNPGALGDDGGEWSVFGLANDAAGLPGCNLIYDPTNGTISIGDVVRFCGATNGVPQVP